MANQTMTADNHWIVEKILLVTDNLSMICDEIRMDRESFREWTIQCH